MHRGLIYWFFNNWYVWIRTSLMGILLFYTFFVVISSVVRFSTLKLPGYHQHRFAMKCGSLASMFVVFILSIIIQDFLWVHGKQEDVTVTSRHLCTSTWTVKRTFWCPYRVFVMGYINFFKYSLMYLLFAGRASTYYVAVCFLGTGVNVDFNLIVMPETF